MQANSRIPKMKYYCSETFLFEFLVSIGKLFKWHRTPPMECSMDFIHSIPLCAESRKNDYYFLCHHLSNSFVIVN